MTKVLLATIPSNPDLTTYCAYLGVNHPMIISGVVHQRDKHFDTCILSIKSIERYEYPEPNLIRGVLEMDMNRPGQDAGSDHQPCNVVIEQHSYPRTFVYAAEGYCKEIRIVESPEGKHYPVINGYKCSAQLFGAKRTYASILELPAMVRNLSQRFMVPEDQILFVDEYEVYFES